MADENFYATFTDRHRGSRALVKSRLAAAYLPFIEPLKQLYADCTALDLGCGRGEWLELLEEHGFKPRGIDLDEAMLTACRERGFSVEKQDAIGALMTLADESQVIVSGFHIVEHIPFEALQTLVREAMRVLKPGGLMILETPNPENILVSTSGFFLDPTHQRPIPLHLLAFLAEYYGFARIKVLRLHESSGLASKPAVTLMDVLEGVSPDYAIIAQKSCSEAQMAITGQPFAVEKGLTLDALAAQYDRQADSRIARIDSRMAQADSRIAQIDSRMAQADSRIAQIDSRMAQADSRIAQAELRATRAEMERQALYASRSWRITAPLRWPGIQARLLRQYGLVVRLKMLAKKIIRPIARRGVAFLSARPELRLRCVTWAKRFGLYEPFRAFYSWVASPSMLGQSIVSDLTLTQLTPHARHIYADLKAAIEKNREAR